MRRLVWPVALPLAAGGVVVAHSLAYTVTVPSAQRASVLAETGHGWQRHLPLLAALASGLLIVGLIRRVLSPRGTGPSAWRFAVLPPLALALQEQIERGGPALDSTIVAGVLFAVPLGLLAYALARTLLRVSDLIGDALRAVPLVRARRPAPARPPATAAPQPAFAGLLGARGPPAGG